MDQSPFDATGAQFAWDSTSIKLFETCPRKYQYKMIEGWQPERKSVHLIFGGLYATALENYHKAIAAGVDHFEAMCDVVHETLIATWDHEEDEDGPILGTGQPWTPDHNTKTRANLIRTIVWYLDQFGVDDSCKTVILSTGEAAVEHSFKLPVDNGIIFAGHLDRMVEYSGHIYVQDQKTTGTTISGHFFNGFSPDTQMSMYTFAGQLIFKLPVKGVMIDGAQIAVGFTRFERGFTFRDSAQLNEWYDDTMKLIERAQLAAREKQFPMNPSSCGNFGGCEFRHICNRSPTVRKQFLKADFVRGEIWNPLRSR